MEIMKTIKHALCLVLILTGCRSFGQGFQLGVKGGVNISNFMSSSNPNGNSYSSLVGWNAGAFVNFMVGHHFSISPELLYSTAGAKVQTTTSGNNSNTTVNDDLKLAYLSVPVMAKYRFTGGFYLETGPEVNFNVSSSHWENQSVKSFTQGAEFAWGAGLGFHSPIGLGIGARYNLGISPVNNVNQASFNDVNLRNSGFMIGLFWTLFNNRR
jgi:hypothetical protein